MLFAPLARSGVLAAFLVPAISAAVALPGAAFAAEPPAAASGKLDQARELGRQALQAQDARDFAEAERLFSAALKLYDAPTLRLGRARAAVELGHWLAARDDYRTVIAAAAGAGETEAFAQARSAAETELAALLPRIPKLTLVVVGSEPVSITVDDLAWTGGSGSAESVDPGTHRVRAGFASGPVQREVTVLEGTAQRLELAPAPVVAAVTPASAGAAATEPAAPATHSEADASGNAGTWVAVITTGALVVGAVVTGIVTLNKRAEYADKNREDVPYHTKKKLRDSAATWAWVNTGLTAGAVVGAGVTTFVVLSQAPSASKPAQADGLMVGVSGRF